MREVDRKLNSSLAEIRERNNATSPSAAGGGGVSGSGSGGSQIRAKTRITIPSVRRTPDGWSMIVYTCACGQLTGRGGWWRTQLLLASSTTYPLRDGALIDREAGGDGRGCRIGVEVIDFVERVIADVAVGKETEYDYGTVDVCGAKSAGG